VAQISEEEKRRRREGNESVFGTHAMEGLEPDEATRAIFHRYAEGDLTMEQFSEAMDQHVHQLLAAQGKMVGVA